MLRLLLLLSLLLLGVTVSGVTFVAKLDRSTDPEVWAAQHTNVRWIRALNNTAQNLHLFHSDEAQRFQLKEDEWMVVQNARRQHKRSISDPLYPSQWHLHGPNKFSVDARRAWAAYNRDGAGIRIAIVDDGLQWRHPELSHAYDASHSYDFNANDNDPTPSSYDGHGTSAAGAAVAEKNNGHCGVGVAPGARVAGLRLIAGPVADYQEAEALLWAHRDTDIYSCSWGPYDGGNAYVGPGRLTEHALAQGVAEGRSGRGSIYVWAGGNGRNAGDNCNYDGYANNPHTIAIGAIDARGRQAWYSESCSALVAVAPSSGAPGRGIRTTDLLGSAGYDVGECTSTFGGTSAAAPIAAGTIALLLQHRPTLGWRDVQNAIALSSKKVSGDDWSSNSRNYTHSHHFGFGVINAPALLAVDAPPLPQRRTVRSSGGGGNLHLTFDSENTLDFVEHVELHVVFTQNIYHGKLELSLVSPEGVTSVMAERHENNRNYGPLDWTFRSVRHWGERMGKRDGVWRVHSTIVPHSIDLIIHGHDSP